MRDGEGARLHRVQLQHGLPTGDRDSFDITDHSAITTHNHHIQKLYFQHLEVLDGRYLFSFNLKKNKK